MKKIIFVAVFFFSSSVYADKIKPDQQEVEVPTGVKIVNSNELGLTKKLLDRFDARRKEYIDNGYIKIYSKQARELLALNKSNYNFSLKNEKNVYGTDLKRNLKNISLAFPFSGIRIIQNEYVIGYAAAGTYMNGWTGVAEYFHYKEIYAVCHYLINNVALTKGGILLRDDIIGYEVNNKPTNINIEGNKKSGYLYEVNWYGDDYFQTLECARKNYDKDTITKVVDLAKQVDKQIS